MYRRTNSVLIIRSHIELKKFPQVDNHERAVVHKSRSEYGPAFGLDVYCGSEMQVIADPEISPEERTYDDLPGL